MNLLFRFIRSVILSITQLLVFAVTATLRFLIIVVITALFRFVLWPFLTAVLRLFHALVALSLSAVVTGPTRFIDRLAGEWTVRIVTVVDNRDHISELYQICRFTVGALIVLGWSATGFFTFQILRIVFGFFT